MEFSRVWVILLHGMWVQWHDAMAEPDGVSNQKSRCEKPRFIADAMLGKLARWLRLLGYDTLYLTEEDTVIAQRTRSENRILLTRDRGLAERRGLRVILVSSTGLDQQVAEINTVVPILPRNPRCMSCNMELESIPLEMARLHVPPYIAAVHGDFRQCPKCGRIFWPGTHWTSIRERLSRALAQDLRDVAHSDDS